jgi:hypothetical protein
MSYEVPKTRLSLDSLKVVRGGLCTASACHGTTCSSCLFWENRKRTEEENIELVKIFFEDLKGKA